MGVSLLKDCLFLNSKSYHHTSHRFVFIHRILKTYDDIAHSLQGIIDPIEKFPNVHSCHVLILRSDRLVHARLKSVIDSVICADLVFRFFLDILIDSYSAVDKALLRQHRLEDFVSVVQINAMQILSLDFFLSDDLDTIKHAKLGDMIKDLAAEVLLVLYWVKAEVQLSQQVQPLDILKLKYLHDIVKGEVEEAKGVNVLQAGEVLNVVLGEVELLEVGQVAETRDFADFILG